MMARRMLWALALVAATDALLVTTPLGSDKPWQFVSHFVYGKVAAGSAAAKDTWLTWQVEGAARADLEVWLFSDYQHQATLAHEVLQGGNQSLSYADRCDMIRTGTHESTPFRADASIPPTEHLTIPDGVRDRVWYLYVAARNCSAGTISPGGTFRAHFHNAGGFFRAELGRDKQGVLETALVCVAVVALFTCAYVVRAAGVRCACGQRGADGEKEAPAKGVFHPVMRFYAAAAALQGVSYALVAGSYWHLASHGTEVDALRVGGEVTDTCAGLMMLLLVVLYALQFRTVDVGHAAAGESLERRRGWAAVVCGALLVAHATLTTYRLGMDAWSTAYVYETPPGLVLAGLRVPLAVYYAHTLWRTVREAGAGGGAAGVSVWVGVGFGCYVAALPCLVFVSYVLDAWYRFKVVFVADAVVRTGGFLGMGWVLWPGARAERLLVSGYESVGTTGGGLELDVEEGELL